MADRPSHPDYLDSSAGGFGCFSRRAAVMALMVLMIAPDGFASPVRGISTPATNPIVPMTPEGGVLMVPLTAQQHGDSWPARINVTLEDGRAITGHVAWISATPRRHDAGWTDSALGLSVRSIRPTDLTGAVGYGQRTMGEGARSAQPTALSTQPTAAYVGSPFLLAKLPPDAHGTIRLLNQTLRPRWLYERAEDRVETRNSELRTRNSNPSDMIKRVRAYDRPDPDHPLEYWRWVLLADRLGKYPPPPPGSSDDETLRLAALYTAKLWQAALARAREHSQGMADHLRDLLTRICTDEEMDVSFAAWVADPVAVNALLNILLDDEIDASRLIDRALEWADAHERLMVWLESATERYARVAIVNPSFRPKIAQLRWDDPAEIPIAVELPAGKLTRVRFERGSGSERDSLGAARRGNALGEFPARTAQADRGPEVLLIETEERTYTLMLDTPVQPVLPPGVYLPPLSPTLALASVQQGQPPVAPERYATTAQLRRLQGRWELFVESRRPANHNRDEVVALFIGEDRDGDAQIILRIREGREYELERGRGHPALRVHQRSLDDRWFCRIVLPDAWLNVVESEATDLGVLRTYGDAGSATSPMPAVPWRLRPGRLSFDLSRWDDVPRE